MKPLRLSRAGIVLAGAIMAAPASAGSLTLSTGRVEPDTNGFDSATTANLRFGNEIFDVGLAEFDLEFELATDIEPGTTANGRDYGFTSVGAHLSARTAGPLYLLARYGVARNEFDIDGGGDTTETQHGVGLGVGASAGIVQIELLATQYRESGDLDDVTWISAGVRF